MKRGAIYTRGRKISDGIFDGRRKKGTEKVAPSRGDRKIADRIKAVLMFDSGWSNMQIAEALLLDEDAIGQHISEYHCDKGGIRLDKEMYSTRMAK